jgi:flagellar basal-body rod modification protein FlgD
MSVNGASGASGSNNSIPGTSANSVQSQFQVFLSLLTTELQNQDPTQPLNSSQFTSQLAQFSQLEETLQTNSLLQTVANNSSSNAIGGALGYIGHTVEATGDNFTLPGASSSSSSSSGSDGSNAATLAFALASTGTSATITIQNSAGTTVATETMSNPTAGNNTFSFNGNDSSGNPLPAGTYTFAVSATDSTGNPIQSTTFTSGKVTGLSDSSGTAELSIDGLLVPAANVVQVTS